MISIVPFEIIAYSMKRPGEELNYVLIEFLKLPRMLRLARFRKRASHKGGANLLRMFWLALIFIYIAHIVACLWWLIGRAGLPGVDVGVDAHSETWILRMEARDEILLLARNGSISSSVDFALWSSREAQSLIPPQYLTSMYWALTALLKTPSIGPDTPLEKVFSTVVTSKPALPYLPRAHRAHIPLPSLLTSPPPPPDPVQSSVSSSSPFSSVIQSRYSKQSATPTKRVVGSSPTSQISSAQRSSRGH
jgi:hypothetical protein